MPLLAALDQGTTGTRCFLFDLEGRIAASAYREHAQIFPHPGWVEHDPVEIRDNVERVLAEARAQSPREEILALGVTNQRETVVAWDSETGLPAGNAIVWQDTRTGDDCRALIATGIEEEVRARTGLPIRTYFSATKIRWILAHVSAAAELATSGRLRIGTIDTWVIWNLTGGAGGGAHVTDPTNASRTLLCALDTLQWDPWLLERFGVSERTLPRILPSIAAEPYGFTRAGGPLGAPVPVCADLGDQQSALFGQACFFPGDAKNTYGTGSFLLQHVGETPVAEPQRSPRHSRRRAGGRPRVRPGGLGRGHGLRRAVAARRPRRHPRCGGDGSDRAVRPGFRRRVLRPGFLRPLRSALGHDGAGRDRRG